MKKVEKTWLYICRKFGEPWLAEVMDQSESANDEGMVLCSNSSAKLDCNCDEDEFTCDCIKKGSCTKQEGCINKTVAIKVGFVDCPNVRIQFGTHNRYNIFEHNLKNVSECNEIGFPTCDNSTCYQSDFLTWRESKCQIARRLVCTSYCPDRKYCHHKMTFKCADNSYIFLDQFCDGIKDCADGSDEIKNQPGFKCNECVLPQNNLYDDLAQCNDCSDLCSFANNQFCFQCFDKRLLISSSQVCDGVKDCFDLSDECLCDSNSDNEMCKKLFDEKNLSFFETKNLNSLQHISIHVTNASEKSTAKECPKIPSDIQATHCGRTSNCTDERPCFNRFQCNGKDNYGVCNALSDYVKDNFQQIIKSKSRDTGTENIFSSSSEMIADPLLRYTVWIMGLMVLLSNFCVIVHTVVSVKRNKMLKVFKFQKIIILNISISDFMMGAYLLAIAAYSAKFSGKYALFDSIWRSSTKCSVIGSLSIISSETSCFLMVILTAFRLRNISQPLKSLNYSLLPWKLSIVVVWLLSICLGIAPILNKKSLYFVHSLSFSSRFYPTGRVNITTIQHFMCRYAALSNKTIKNYGNEFQTIKHFLEKLSPGTEPVSKFGYYGASSVCLPRFYVERGEPAWEYTIFFITINFLCFMFIAVCYIVIFKRSFKFSKDVDRNGPDKDAMIMQKRITRIVVTDFCCWIPVCIMAYLRLDGIIRFSPILYQITAAVLLPINSVLNPFLFSSLSDKLINLFRFKLSNFCEIFSTMH